ncbi:MAG: hypothetical protein IJI45_08785 [Anaerolineaceae bacterium]|nr:hypothetical protein [Anaerolineaceae bacterium]
MNKSKFFVLFLLITAICLVSFSAVLADQEGNRRWCNSDQYGCWVTDENGGQSYLMFFSESARDLFMGPGSSAPVVPAVPGGEMGLSAAPEEPAAPAAPAAPADPVEGGGQQGDQNDPEKHEAALKYAEMLWDDEDNWKEIETAGMSVEDLAKDIEEKMSLEEINNAIETYNPNLV